MSESANYTSEQSRIKTEAVAHEVRPGGASRLAAERESSHEIFPAPQASTEMPTVVPSKAAVSAASAAQDSQAHTESVFKLERSESAKLAEPTAREHPGFVGEEPLEIQCGENSALLYVSKLCQGSKGPCILFNNEWLTPNELQYISGRETAKDWKRSIRYKGKSLKSLIARGLIKVHPPICDCLGCRISSPVNRGRLASKCGLTTPTSPRSRKRDAVKSLSCWGHEELEATTAHRHYSTSDIECLARQATTNGLGFKERRESSSSGTSESSETNEDNPFSPVKRPKSISPENTDDKTLVFKRRASDSASLAFFPSHPGGEGLHYDPRAISMHRELTARYLMSGDRGMHPQEVPGDQKDKASRGSDETGPRGPEGTKETRSAFRAVHQDGMIGLTLAEVNPEVLQREMAVRAAKLNKQKPPLSPGRAPAQFLPAFSHHITGPGLVSPTYTSPRFPHDPLLLAGHPSSNIYHPALRGAGYPSMQQLQQNLMQYRLLAPPGAANSPHSPLAGLTLQNKLLMHEAAAMATNANMSTSAHVSEQTPRYSQNGVSPKRRRVSCENPPENDRRHSVVASEEPSEKREEAEYLNGDRTNHVSVINRTPVHSPVSVDGFSESRASPGAKEPLQRVFPHKLIPKLRLELDDDIVKWTVDDVCQFIASLTGVPEVVNEFKDQSIDGQSLILLQEEHLLNRMGIKLGPALKIKAHIRKILEKLQATDENHQDNIDSS